MANICAAISSFFQTRLLRTRQSTSMFVIFQGFKKEYARWHTEADREGKTETTP